MSDDVELRWRHAASSPETMLAPRAAASFEKLVSTDIFTVANAMADAARKHATRYFRSVSAYDRKDDDSPVTIVDKCIEADLRRLVTIHFPDHSILGEEMGAWAGNDSLWVIDPIDGTKSFITGMPLFGTLIAYVEQDEPLLGIIEMPALSERWIGANGTTRKNGKICTVSGCEEIENARVFTSSPDMFAAAGDWNRYDRLSKQAAIRRFGGDCYQYALLASGHCDLVVEASLMPYDYMALVPVVENAGGYISDWQGNALTCQSDGRVIAAASYKLWQTALSELNL